MIECKSERLRALPPYLFSELNRRRNEVAARGVDIIDMGVGDPDLPTPRIVVEAMKKAVENPANHRYPTYTGMPSFREAVAAWFLGRFKVKLDPATQVIGLIGSKEGIGHLPLAVLNPGDVALIPEPGYPVYGAATLFAGAEAHYMPLLESNAFLPDLDAIPASVLKKARLIFLNYPNNPTAGIAGVDFYRKTVIFAKKHGLIVASDAAYSEMGFGGYRAPSFLEAEGAMDVGIEFHSLSKTFNMTGWRVGFAVGNPEIVGALTQFKTNMDSGIFQAVQEAAITALLSDQTTVGESLRIYQERRDLIVGALNKMWLTAPLPKATFYVWFHVPAGYTSASFATKLLEETGVVVTPGLGFGPSGEGYARISLTVPTERCREAVRRMEKAAF